MATSAESPIVLSLDERRGRLNAVINRDVAAGYRVFSQTDTSARP